MLLLYQILFKWLATYFNDLLHLLKRVGEIFLLIIKSSYND
jgi:hypothetical protein